ncbi:glucosaminidase domain-containing protein [Staphylococcus warneri]|uniref:glucosaminidase domain-containing protein n=1 Tax=Staphylococcus warneri TaxID=1292 RepID=UPI000D1D28B2|nr:glucosaminidase domain-containing protein [Staphylococcus warneri]PTI21308.1 CHAP domain-containing protein [Staphylococcus warneri]PTI26741.1 CHAP domain-containing protein [Staphylococcus warneri]RIM98160.1 CHAP domain-containing protein [Staphylococcus warneri]RIN03293.1 CHAP domain-containing protein [Staphylococcus warneri]
MGLPSPKKRKPRASEVVEWALHIAKNKIPINVDGRMGPQCWDLPNYLLGRYWGFWTWGNANAMAQKANYRGRNFKIYRNTPNFVPKPGDWGVWTGGWAGHVNIVVGPCTKDYWYGVDQNWYTNNTTGSPPYKVKHTYSDGPGGVRYFVRPPYSPEIKKPDPQPDDKKDDKKTSDVKEDVKPTTEKKTIWKDVTRIKYTSATENVSYPENIYHFIAQGDERNGKPKGLLIRNARSMCSVEDLYNTRLKYKRDSEYPHFYVDRNHIWAPRKTLYKVPSEPDYIVLEVCEDYSSSKQAFILNEIHAMIMGVEIMNYYNIPIKNSTVKVDKSIWRSMLEHVNWDIISKSDPPPTKYEDLEKAILKLYDQREKLLKSTPKEVVTKSKIKVTVDSKSSTKDTVKDVVKDKTKSSSKPSEPKITTVTNKYTLTQALNAQIARGYPQKSNGYSWYFPSRSAVSSAMNPTTIWNSSTQRYQMLNLGKYQGISVSKLNRILKGKGSLSGQGKAVAQACKKYNINEIYLISHAFLESGNGTSYFASGSAGIYNYFGIGAFDNNPNNAVPFARKRGWTTPAKGIIGGAKFVRQDYINKGQNTLYRMRWNPKHPATHQYATDINWCSHQAENIAYYYKKIGLKGMYYVRDKYK